MRGDAERQAFMLTPITPDHLVPDDHPIRAIKPIVEGALSALSPTFNEMYSAVGRPSIPPEHLLKGSVLIALYSIRSERQFCERLRYDLLFKWFLDLNIMEPAFDASSFSKNPPKAGWSMRCRDSSSIRCFPRPDAAGCCRTTTSRWMGRCSRPGPL